jgi:hypothetical protein
MLKRVVHILTILSQTATQAKFGYTLRPPLHIGFLLEHNLGYSVLSYLNGRPLAEFKSLTQTKRLPAWRSDTLTGLSFHNNERTRVSPRFKL